MFQTKVLFAALTFLWMFNRSSSFPEKKLGNLDASKAILNDMPHGAVVGSDMDELAIDEVRRTGQPFTKLEIDENGTKRTITYAMQADGSISKHTRTEYRPISVIQTHPQNIIIANPKLAPTFPSEKEVDWEWNPKKFPIFAAPPNSFHQIAEKPEAPEISRPGTVPTNSSQWHTKYPASPSLKMNATMPTLEEFLRSQYETTTKNPSTGFQDAPVPIWTVLSQKPAKETKFVTTIDINDLPVAEILSTKEVSSNQMPASADHKNHIPNAYDLNPAVKDILQRAGISPTNVMAGPDRTVTKTRTEPDGKIITTTYRMRTVPTAVNWLGTDSTHFSGTFVNERPQVQFLFNEKPRQANEKSGIQFTTTNMPNEARITGNVRPGLTFIEQDKPTYAATRPTINVNPIDGFLANFNLTAEMLGASNGEITKTIIDDDGRVLTSTFVLSTVRNDDKHSQKNAENKPIKRII